METSAVRRRVQHAMASAKTREQDRKRRAADATREYAAFLETVATPLVQQIANVLKAEGYAFTLSTPGDSLQLANDRGRDDFIELALDTTFDQPQVVGRISRSCGSRRLNEERPIKPDASPAAITEQDVLEFVAQALEPWLAR
jgi:ribosomal protein S8